MFTGLIQALGTVREATDEPHGKRLTIAAAALATDAALGDSIAINGCCLTVVEIAGDCLSFQAGEETLSKTNLGGLTVGSKVNLEPSLRVGDRLGGHFVCGHIEAQGALALRQDDDDWSKVWFHYPAQLGRYLVPKGSIAVDGVSLTLVDVEPSRFSVALIPHTLAHTTLGTRKVGDAVNLETDLLAKYAQKQADDSNSQAGA